MLRTAANKPTGRAIPEYQRHAHNHIGLFVRTHARRGIACPDDEMMVKFFCALRRCAWGRCSAVRNAIVSHARMGVVPLRKAHPVRRGQTFSFCCLQVMRPRMLAVVLAALACAISWTTPVSPVHIPLERSSEALPRVSLVFGNPCDAAQPVMMHALADEVPIVSHLDELTRD